MTITSVYIEKRRNRENAAYFEVSVLFDTEPEQTFIGLTADEAIESAQKAIPEIIERDIEIERI
jgi:hypothetical protein